MNALRMQYEFQKRSGLNLESSIVESYLNIAQNMEFTERYSKYYGSPVNKFDFTERTKRELGNLIEPFSTTDFDSSSDSLHENSVYVILPSDYLYGIEERCIINTGTDTATVKVLPLTYNEYIENTENPFLWPDDDLVWRLDIGNTGATGIKRHELVHGENTIEEYKVRYIRRPQQIIIHPDNWQDSELDESIHDNIVNRAISMVSPASNNNESEVKPNNRE